MKHVPVLSLAVVVVLVVAASGCKTDDAKKASPADAGATAASGGPTSMPATRAAADAGPAAAATVVDAGATATAIPTGTGAGATATSAGAGEGKSSIYDRVLVKQKGADDVEAVKAMVEKKLGAKVAIARKSVGKWVMIQLAPTPGGRSAADQGAVVELLKQVDAFETVEADRLMKIK